MSKTSAVSSTPAITLTTARLVSSSSLLVLASMVANLGNYFFQAIAGRMLSVEEFGVMNTLLGLGGATLVPVGAMGIAINRWVSMHDAASDHRAINAILRRACRRLFCYALGIVVLLVMLDEGIQKFLHLPHSSPLWGALAWIITGLYAAVFMAGLQGLRRFGWVATLIVTGVVARVAFGYILMRAGWESTGGLCASVGANLICLLLSVWALWSLFCAEYERDFDTRPIYRYLVPVAVPMTLWSLQGNMDMVIVKHFFSPIDAGYYAAAGLFGRALVGLVMPVTIVLFPEWSRGMVVRETRDAHRHLLFRAMVITGLMGGIVALICTLWPQGPLYLLKGKQEPRTQELLPLFVWAMLPLAIAWVPYSYRLATAELRHLYRLLPVFAMYMGGLLLWHSTLKQVLAVVAIAGITTSVVMCRESLLPWKGSRRPRATTASHAINAGPEHMGDA